MNHDPTLIDLTEPEPSREESLVLCVAQVILLIAVVGIIDVLIVGLFG